MGAGGLGDGFVTGEGKVVNEWWLEEEGQGWEKQLMWKEEKRMKDINGCVRRLRRGGRMLDVGKIRSHVMDGSGVMYQLSSECTILEIEVGSR
ncbi:unnamed protein product [Citrullus colocynthis]|uniref:Uncharacterized protein n=1 Tax=Citrullus colocynthis TaxID=252529 RepID=A0ABP0YFS6_9ROSI